MMRPMTLYMAAEQLRVAADAMRRAEKALEDSPNRHRRAEAQRLRDNARELYELADRWQDEAIAEWDTEHQAHRLE